MANSYEKRPLWQWVLVYVVIGAVVYGLIYYVWQGKRSASDTTAPPSQDAGGIYGY